MNILVLGAGAWGTALSIHLAARHQITLWTRSQTHLDEMSLRHMNQRYLPGYDLPESIRVTTQLDSAIKQIELILITVPVSGLRDVLKQLTALNCVLPLILACKGLEAISAKLPHQIVSDVYSPTALYGVLSGPSFAQEIAQGLPAALTLASHDQHFATMIAGKIHTTYLRIYASSDVIGVEIAGALKNVIAIAAGIADGMAFGNNARAALITRGLAEITRLGVALGGCQETFMGLAGVGDLILTCTGDLSRNRKVGILLSSGLHLPEILSQIGHVTEGVYTASEAHTFAGRHGIDMPVTETVYRILYEKTPVQDAIQAMLQREPKSEICQ
ncbi:MAG TPA: NAD(P)H-dependent glycerol-3-phosphate dehydrogenase [Nitrosomonas mobilis]|nr:NAD(P)H-dependent glycerol-3-phosphate dehydrogenase [Nitrosomonas mobilis]